LSKLKFAGITVLVLSVFVGLVAYGNFRDVAQKLAEYPVSYLLLALSLAFINYFLRFLRWAYFLKLLEIDVPFRASVVIFMTGLALSITPAKVGEFLKCYLLRRKFNVPISGSASVVVMERLGDVGSVLLVGLTGIAFLPEISFWVIGCAAVSLVGLVLVLKSGHSEWLYRLPLLSRWKQNIKTSETSFKRLVKADALTVSLFLGVVAWLSEGIALYVILKGLGAEVLMFCFQRDNKGKRYNHSLCPDFSTSTSPTRLTAAQPITQNDISGRNAIPVKPTSKTEPTSPRRSMTTTDADPLIGTLNFLRSK
jgi:uncharacterized membrane protein YbhN (UPF0104 family)